MKISETVCKIKNAAQKAAKRYSTFAGAYNREGLLRADIIQTAGIPLHHKYRTLLLRVNLLQLQSPGTLRTRILQSAREKI